MDEQPVKVAENKVSTAPAAGEAKPGNCVCRCGLLLPILGVVALVLMILYQAGVFIPDQVRPGRTILFAEPVAGETVAAIVEQLPLIYRTPGTVESREEVGLAARLAARITAIAVRPGDRVAKGDLLVLLDDVDLQATVEGAVQRLAGAKTRVVGAAGEILAAAAELELATLEKTRGETLVAEGAMAQRDLDFAVSRYRRSLASLEQARMAEAAAKAEVAALEQALKFAQATLDYATLTSPFDGVVAARLAEPGDLAAPGRPILRLFNPAVLRLVAPVRESLVGSIELGMTVPFEVPALGRELTGTVSEIVPAVEPGSRTFLVRICVGAEDGLLPGMFGELKLPLGQRAALLVPATAVRRAGQLEYLQVVDADGRLTRRLVRTVAADDGRRQVLAGLAAGERYVVN